MDKVFLPTVFPLTQFTQSSCKMSLQGHDEHIFDHLTSSLRVEKPVCGPQVIILLKPEKSGQDCGNDSVILRSKVQNQIFHSSVQQLNDQYLVLSYSLVFTDPL